jgi:Alpha-acetolactate decarboxylase
MTATIASDSVFEPQGMRSGLVMVLKILRQDAAQMMFVKDDDVIQTFAERRKVEMLFAHLNWHLCGWSPGFLGAFSVPKYHFHFLSDDHQHGGHVLERAAPSLRLRMEALTNFHLALPERAAFLKADLNKNSSDELAYSEEAHYANTNGGKIRPADWCYRGQTAQMIGC